MPDDRDDRIRRRAHEIWERDGRPHGKHAEHWERAAREVDAEAAVTKQAGSATRARGKAGTSRSSPQPGGTVAESGAAAGRGNRPGKPAGGTKRTRS